MPSSASTARIARSRAATPGLPATGRKAVPPPDAAKRDVRTEARQARTREYMRAENEREAALAKQGYWF